MVGFWATLSLNMPDFTRYGRSQREQMLGQAVALPTTMLGFRSEERYTLSDVCSPIAAPCR